MVCLCHPSTWGAGIKRRPEREDLENHWKQFVAFICGILLTIFILMPARWTDIPMILILITLVWLFERPLSALSFKSYLFLTGWALARDLEDSLHADTFRRRDSARAAHEWFWGK